MPIFQSINQFNFGFAFFGLILILHFAVGFTGVMWPSPLIFWFGLILVWVVAVAGLRLPVLVKRILASCSFANVDFQRLAHVLNFGPELRFDCVV